MFKVTPSSKPATSEIYDAAHHVKMRLRNKPGRNLWIIRYEHPETGVGCSFTGTYKACREWAKSEARECGFCFQIGA